MCRESIVFSYIVYYGMHVEHVEHIEHVCTNGENVYNFARVLKRNMDGVRCPFTLSPSHLIQWNLRSVSTVDWRYCVYKFSYRILFWLNAAVSHLKSLLVQTIFN